MTNKPYVVSGDIDILLAQWATNHRFRLPSKKFFRTVRSVFVEKLRSIFGNVEFIPSCALQNPKLISASGEKATLVTLDKTYVNSKFNIELTRTALPDLTDGPLSPRQNHPDLATQIKMLRKRLRRANTIVVYDDVIFTGHLLESVCAELESAGFKIATVMCGVGIQSGIDRINRRGLTVASSKAYDEVVDQVCERDFYPGIDYSGRTLHTDHAVGLPYLLPFGNPCSWASIPREQATNFSRFCIGQSIHLFQEIERQTCKLVLCSDIDRKLTNWPDNGTRFVDYLEVAESEIH